MSTKRQVMLAIVVAAVAIIAVLAAVTRHALNEWACRVNWSAPCANGALAT